MKYSEFNKQTPQLNSEQTKAVYTQLSNSAINTIFKTFIKGVKFSGSAAGTVVSAGAAGDTIPDLIFVLMDVGILSANINKFTKGTKLTQQYIDDLMKIKWTGNPDDIKDKVQNIVDDIIEDPNGLEVMNKLCFKFEDVTDSLAAIVASLLAVFIPSDAGFTRLAVEEIISRSIRSGSANSFETLKGVYKTIPKKGRDTLDSKVKLKKLLNDILKYYKKVAIAKDETWGEWATNTKNSLFIPGGLWLRTVQQTPAGRLLDYSGKFESIIDNTGSNIPLFVNLIHTALVLVFAASVMLQNCKNKEEIFSKKDKKSIKKDKKSIKKSKKSSVKGKKKSIGRKSSKLLSWLF